MKYVFSLNPDLVKPIAILTTQNIPVYSGEEALIMGWGSTNCRSKYCS